jgi:hypothetical protein
MKTLTTMILALGATALLGTTGLYAQTRVVADIPFDFTVETVTMPAGQYVLQPIANLNGALRIANLETHKSVLVLAPSAASTYKGNPTDTGKVIFHRYGDRYFFSEVWGPYGPRGRATPTRLEQEIRERSAEKQMASVAIPQAAGK